MNDVDIEAQALAEELLALVKAGAVHSAAAHESEAAKKDDGNFRWCGGCRRTVLSKRLAELESVKDDHGKLGVEVVLAKLKERREVERPK